MKNTRIFLVSLKQAEKRREALKANFPSLYKKFIHIDAVDGRLLNAKEYFDKIKPFSLKHKRIMTPSELGCSLSHIKALSEFLKTDANYALIIEDDIIGSDKDIEKLSSSLASSNFEGLVFLGCQEGLLNRYKYVRLDKNGFYKIPFSNRMNFSRTAAYAVSRKIAKDILDFHNTKYITVADYWFETLRNSRGKFYYLPGLKHPLDLSDSLIEADRMHIEKSIFSKLFSPKIFKLFFKWTFRELKLWIYLFLGYKNIKNIDLNP